MVEAVANARPLESQWSAVGRRNSRCELPIEADRLLSLRAAPGKENNPGFGSGLGNWPRDDLEVGPAMTTRKLCPNGANRS